MTITMNLREKFELSDGITVLACSGCDSAYDAKGKKFRLISADAGKEKQILTITGERIIPNKNANIDQRAFETNDTVQLSSDEARSGDWLLVEERTQTAVN